MEPTVAGMFLKTIFCACYCTAVVFSATNVHDSVSDRIDLKVEKAEEIKQCLDDPTLANCALIVQYNLCDKNAYYAEFCCASCTAAGQPLYVDPPPKTEESPSSQESTEEEEGSGTNEEQESQESLESADGSGSQSDESVQEPENEEAEYESADGTTLDLPPPEYEEY